MKNRPKCLIFSQILLIKISWKFDWKMLTFLPEKLIKLNVRLKILIFEFHTVLGMQRRYSVTRKSGKIISINWIIWEFLKNVNIFTQKANKLNVQFKKFIFEFHTILRMQSHYSGTRKSGKIISINWISMRILKTL